MFKKGIKYSLITIITILLIAVASSVYFLTTNSGLKNAIRLVNHFTAYEITTESISGSFLGQSELKKLHITGKNFDFSSDLAILDWQSKALWNKSLVIRSIAISDASIILTPNDEKQTSSPEKSYDLSDINLPFDIQLEELLITNFVLKNPVTGNNENNVTNEPKNTGDITIDKFQLGIGYKGQKATIHTFILEAFDTSVNLTGELTTKDTFSLSLKSTGDFQQQHYKQHIAMSIDGAIKDALVLAMKGQGAADFTLDATLSSIFEEPELVASFALDKIDDVALGLTNTTLQATANITAKIDDAIHFTNQGEINFDSPETDALKFAVESQFDGNTFLFDHLQLDLLDAEQKIVGNGEYSTVDKTIDFSLSSDALQWPQLITQPDFTFNNSEVRLNGTIDHYNISLNTTGTTQDYGDIVLSGNGQGNTQSIDDFAAQILFNQQPATLKTSVQWSPKLNYSADIQADKISHFNRLPEIKGLSIQVAGDDHNYSGKGKLHISRDDIPSTDLNFLLSGNRQSLQNATVNVETLGGEITAIAQGALSPLNLQAIINTKNIRPQTFYPNFSGDINSALEVTATDNTGALSATINIKELSGQIENQPLSGSGSVHFDQGDNHIVFDNMLLNIGGNKLDANGNLVLSGTDSTSDLIAAINAPHIEYLIPGSSGQIQANIVAQGTLKAPTLEATIKGNDLSINGQKIEHVTVDIDTHTTKNDDNIYAQATALYKSPKTGTLKLAATGHYDNTSQIKVPTFVLDLLDSKQQLSGTGRINTKSGDLALSTKSESLTWPQTGASNPIKISNTNIDVTGNLSNYQAQGITNITLPAVGDIEIDLKADGTKNNVNLNKISILINTKPIAINGSIDWESALDYQLSLMSPEFKVLQNNTLISNLNLDITGDSDAYKATGDIEIYSDTIPASHLSLDISGTPSTLNASKVDIDTLGGDIAINAQGALTPLDINATVQTKNIQLERHYKNLKSNISSTFSVNAQQKKNNLLAYITVDSLSGSLQGKALSGSGTVQYSQLHNYIDFSDFKLSSAENILSADGSLALGDEHNKSNLIVTLNVPQLQSLHQDLKGSLDTTITIKGNSSAPAIDATLAANALTYDTLTVQKINGTVAANLSNDNIAIDLNLTDIKSGDNVITNAAIKTTGKINNHDIALSINTPQASLIPTVALSGKGNFNTQETTWKGTIAKLTAANKMLGKWSLQKPSSLVLSAPKTTVSKLCLGQKKSSLCVDGTLANGTGGFDIALQSFPSDTLQQFMPQAFQIDAPISGKTKLTLSNGAVNVAGKLSAESGKVVINAGQGGTSAKINKLDTAFTLKNNRLEALLTSDLSKLGKIEITALLPDVRKSSLEANIKVDNKNLSFIEELVPQVSNIKGKLTGDMSISGIPKKSLKVAGKITLHNTDVDIPEFGSEIRALTLDIFAINGNKIGFRGSAKAGEGEFTIDGDINPNTQIGKINLKGRDFQLANSNKLQVKISPDIQVIFADHIKVRGEVLIPKALIVPDTSGSKITVSEDVILPNQKAKKQSASSPVDIEVSIKLGDDVRVASADIETRLNGSIKINAKPGKTPKAIGAIEVETGELRVYGQMLHIERGRIIFSNGPITNPSLDIRTSRTIDGEEITVGANVLGSAKAPEISLFSTPSMAESAILSYLLFGRPPNGDAFGMAALLQTGGTVGANSVARDIRSSLGLDVLDLSLAGVEAGKHLNKKAYVGMRSSFFEGLNEFLLNYKISGRTRVEGIISTEEMSIDLIKIIESD